VLNASFIRGIASLARSSASLTGGTARSQASRKYSLNTHITTHTAVVASVSECVLTARRGRSAAALSNNPFNEIG